MLAASSTVTANGANSVVFHAVIREFGAIPDSEMAEIQEFTELPENLTYPAITPVLFDHLMRKPKLHRMKLQSSPFRKIQNDSKTIELRLNDEKRQQVQVGDFIEFTMLDDTAQKLTVRVTALHQFNSFAELYAALQKEMLGYAADETPDPDHMDAYYPRDKQEKYGVLGIELLKIQTDDPMTVFDYPYAYKVRSYMTLFKYAAPEQELFQKGLDKFCRGMEDDKTVEILGV